MSYNFSAIHVSEPRSSQKSVKKIRQKNIFIPKIHTNIGYKIFSETKFLEKNFPKKNYMKKKNIYPSKKLPPKNFSKEKIKKKFPKKILLKNKIFKKYRCREKKLPETKFWEK